MDDENEILSGSQEGEVVDPQGSDETAAEEAEGGKSSGDAGRNRQSHEENSASRAARHAGDRAGYARAMSEIDQRIAAMGMRSANSGTVISSLSELEAYGRSARRAQLEARAKEEGRTVEELEEEEDNKAYLTRARKKEQQDRERQSAEDKQRAWIVEDAQRFADEYPDVDIGALEGNKAFLKFCGSRYGKEPLAELYGDWLEITGGAAKAASARAQSKSNRSTGSGSGSGSVTLTAEQQRSLDEWNRTYPQMKMSAKEFLERSND